MINLSSRFKQAQRSSICRHYQIPIRMTQNCEDDSCFYLHNPELPLVLHYCYHYRHDIRLFFEDVFGKILFLRLFFEIFFLGRPKIFSRDTLTDFDNIILCI